MPQPWSYGSVHLQNNPGAPSWMPSWLSSLGGTPRVPVTGPGDAAARPRPPATDLFFDPFPGGASFSRGLTPGEVMQRLLNPPSRVGTLPRAPIIPEPVWREQTLPVPQAEMPAPTDWSEFLRYIEAARPTPPSGDKRDIILSGLAGAMANFRNDPGDRLGSVLGRMAGGAGASALGESFAQKRRKEDYEQKTLPEYMKVRAAAAGDIAKGQALHDTQARRMEFENKVLAFENERAQIANKAAFDREVASTAQQNWKNRLSVVESELTSAANDAKVAATVLSFVVPAAKAGRTYAELPSSVALSHIVSDAINKERPIPGMDLGGMFIQAANSVENELKDKLHMLDPSTRKRIIGQRTVSLALEFFRENPDYAAELLRQYANIKVPYPQENPPPLGDLP